MALIDRRIHTKYIMSRVRTRFIWCIYKCILYISKFETHEIYVFNVCTKIQKYLPTYLVSLFIPVKPTTLYM